MEVPRRVWLALLAVLELCQLSRLRSQSDFKLERLQYRGSMKCDMIPLSPFFDSSYF